MHHRIKRLSVQVLVTENMPFHVERDRGIEDCPRSTYLTFTLLIRHCTVISGTVEQVEAVVLSCFIWCRMSSASPCTVTDRENAVIVLCGVMKKAARLALCIRLFSCIIIVHLVSIRRPPCIFT